MKSYSIVYLCNEDSNRNFIEIEAVDRHSAIEWLKDAGREIGMDYDIVSCRLAKPIESISKER